MKHPPAISSGFSFPARPSRPRVATSFLPTSRITGTTRLWGESTADVAVHLQYEVVVIQGRVELWHLIEAAAQRLDTTVIGFHVPNAREVRARAGVPCPCGFQLAGARVASRGRGGQLAGCRTNTDGGSNDGRQVAWVESRIRLISFCAITVGESGPVDWYQV